mmetsp:Transcript_31479/g.65726  ORF Transcript_31479/g.65726 Transcript_31479/m.65726 type:complete len:296 (+) Transcript_31479:1017-1904(+)
MMIDPNCPVGVIRPPPLLVIQPTKRPPHPKHQPPSRTQRNPKHQPPSRQRNPKNHANVVRDVVDSRIPTVPLIVEYHGPPREIPICWCAYPRPRSRRLPRVDRFPPKSMSKEGSLPKPPSANVVVVDAAMPERKKMASRVRAVPLEDRPPVGVSNVRPRVMANCWCGVPPTENSKRKMPIANQPPWNPIVNQWNPTKSPKRLDNGAEVDESRAMNRPKKDRRVPEDLRHAEEFNVQPREMMTCWSVRRRSKICDKNRMLPLSPPPLKPRHRIVKARRIPHPWRPVNDGVVVVEAN